MNRRGFLSSLLAVPAAAYVAPNVFATSAPSVFPAWKAVEVSYEFDMYRQFPIFDYMRKIEPDFIFADMK